MVAVPPAAAAVNHCIFPSHISSFVRHRLRCCFDLLSWRSCRSAAPMADWKHYSTASKRRRWIEIMKSPTNPSSFDANRTEKICQQATSGVNDFTSFHATVIFEHKRDHCYSTHLIDGDGTFNVAGIDNFVKEVNFAECGLSYAVVAIMGPQSSGKSTLLNHLFGTNFREMDASEGRSKTTKGVWLARCIGIEPCTLVMDLEGTDGREIGEDDNAFEKQSALFALAVSDIVLLNMWCHDIGREQAAHKPLLKTVFQVMMRLFSPHKVTLMFVIRDKTKTPVEKLEPVLREDIQKIWDSVLKPQAHTETPLSEFLNIEVVALSSYEVLEEQFEEQVASLRQRFFHSIAPGGLAGDRRGVVPASGFPFSIQKIWKVIKENKDLNLPAHKVMVATVCCEEIANERFLSFSENEEWCQLEERVRSQPVPGFGRKLTSILDACLSQYDVEAMHFDEDVRSSKRKQLEEKLLQLVQPAYQFMLGNICSGVLDRFKEAFDRALNEGNGFAAAAHDCTEYFMSQFNVASADVHIGQANWDSSRVGEKLRCNIDAHIAAVRVAKLSELTNMYETKLDEALADTWPAIRKPLSRETEATFDKREDCCLLQLIDEDGTLNVAGIESFTKEVKLSECGISYAVVAIMGPMSSGKSALLNHMFGTNFRVMDASEGRSKTTKGIWLAQCVGIEPRTLVMDLEGTDGRERGEDDTAFEKQSALFALALSDIVLINMWCHDIGREQGAHKPLLKTIFQVMMRLFSPRKRSLMFVIRDKTRTPLEKLEPVLKDDIQKIWDSVPKPQAHVETPLSKIFNIEVVALSSHEDKEEQFKEQVVSLRWRFFHSIAPGGLAGDRRDVVPASGFSFSTQQIWKFIKEKKDLDLPAHKVMVATVRCEEIANEKYSSFIANEEWCQIENIVQSRPVLGFGKKLTSILDVCLSQYDAEAMYFDEDTRSSKRKQLEEKLLQLVQLAYQFMLGHIYSGMLDRFKKALDNALNEGKGFAVAVRDCTKYFMSQFDVASADAHIGQANWDSSGVREKLRRDIDAHVAAVRVAKLSELTNMYETKLNEALTGPVEALLDAASDDTWPAIRKLLHREIETAFSGFSSALSHFEVDDVTKDKMLSRLEDYARGVVEAKAEEAAKSVLVRMKDRFSTSLGHDSDSKPRVWTGREDIEAIIKTARSASLKLLSVTAAVRLDDVADHIESTLSVTLLGPKSGAAASGSISGDLLTLSSWKEVELKLRK